MVYRRLGGTGGTVILRECNFIYGKGSENHQLGTNFFFVRHRIVSTVKRVEFLSNRMSFSSERSLCNIIVLNVHTPNKEKSDDSKDNFYEELEHVINNFLSNV